MSRNTQTRKTVSAQMDQLRAILRFVTDFASQMEMNPDTIYHCKLAVDEAATNIIEHAYGDAHGEITVEVEADDDNLTIRLSDSGTPFDPYSVPTPDLSASLEQRTPGGLGIFLMHRVMDHVFYEPGPPVNRLTMVKHR